MPITLSYFSGQDWKDHGLKPARENSPQDTISKKKLSPKRTGGLARGAGPEFKPLYCKTNKQLQRKSVCSPGVWHLGNSLRMLLATWITEPIIYAAMKQYQESSFIEKQR
jgi:hypothetical protein